MGAAVGLIVYGTKGYVVFPNYYSSATVFDLDGKEIKTFSGGDDQIHYENFISAVKSRNPDELNASILEGHLSSALCHTANISYRLELQRSSMKSGRSWRAWIIKKKFKRPMVG